MFKPSIVNIVPPGEENPRSCLVVNGTVLEQSSANLGKSGERIHLWLGLADENELVTGHRFSEIAPVIEELYVGLRLPWETLKCSAHMELSIDGTPSLLSLHFYLDTTLWAGPFAFVELYSLIEEEFNRSPIPGMTFHPPEVRRPTTSFSLSCAFRGVDVRVGDELAYWRDAVWAIIELAKTTLETEVEKDTLVEFFDFPAPVRTACEQYLVYFAQFLRDLGIEAEADIRQRGSQVLFAVRPADGAQALDQIRQALDEYLELPSFRDLDMVAANHKDVAVLQLQANVHHLKGQVMLASAVLRARDAEIEALRLSNFRYRGLLAAAQDVDRIVLQSGVTPGKSSVDTVGAPAVDEEPIFDGLLSVTPIEFTGLKINAPEILRRLKRLRRR